MPTRATTTFAPVLPASRWSFLTRWLCDFAARADDICYVPNLGNAGDALIASGTRQLFDAIGLRARAVSAARLAKGASAIYPGGGNLIPDYPDCARFLRQCISVDVKEAVVLPHTIRGHADLLRQLDERFTLFCRDHESLEWCKANARGAKSIFADDLALRLDIRAQQQRCEGLLPLLELGLRTAQSGRLFQYLRWRRYVQSIQPVNGTLTVFRADSVANSRHPGNRHLDIPDYYISAYTHRGEAEFVSRDLLDTVARADVIVTNRLHVGMAGVLLHKRVHLYDNSYGKIHDVYRSSLKSCDLVSFDDVSPRVSRRTRT